MKKRNLPKEILYTVTSLLKGMTVTFSTFWRKKVTLMYPEKRWELPEGYRGMPALPVDPKTGRDKCIACGSCVRICPEQIITLEHEVGEDKKRRAVRFDIDMSRCMFCGLCTEVCPTKGLIPSKEFELSSETRQQMIFDLEDLHRVGGSLPEEPEQPEEEKNPEEDKKPESGGSAEE